MTPTPVYPIETPTTGAQGVCSRMTVSSGAPSASPSSIVFRLAHSSWPAPSPPPAGSGGAAVAGAAGAASQRRCWVLMAAAWLLPGGRRSTCRNSRSLARGGSWPLEPAASAGAPLGGSSSSAVPRQPAVRTPLPRATAAGPSPWTHTRSASAGRPTGSIHLAVDETVHSAAPPSAFSRCINSDGEGMSAE